MEIKDFIKEAMLQIVDGVNEVNTALKEKGAYIPSKQIMGENVTYKVEQDNTNRNIVNVEFDVAIMVSSTDSETMGAKLSVASIFGMNATSEGTKENQTISRIKYTLPLALPDDDIPKHHRNNFRPAKYD